jgi:dihydrofolate synthase/folylpolyglutamate synthase
MGYAAAIDQLLALPGELHVAPGEPRRKFDLAHMRLLLAELGDPHRKFRSVLVAGTNGKGSTSAMLATIVAEAGYEVGLYTSPHLERINERIQFLGRGRADLIADEMFGRLLDQVRSAGERLVAASRLPADPSFFESVTAAAMLAFAEREVDLAVLEVGMGGRLDATNVVEPLLSLITDISLDHVEWLGSSIAEITREKAGILREGGIMVTLPQHPEANQALGEIAVALHVRGVNAAEFMPAQVRGPASREDADGCLVVTIGGESIQLRPALQGGYQHRNIALALAAAAELTRFGFEITTQQIVAGIEGVRWPGRLERITLPDGLHVVLDVAHNPAGAWALRAAVSDMQNGGHLDSSASLSLIFGCLEDKAVEEMAAILMPVFDRVMLTTVESPRTASLSRLIAAAERSGAPYEACIDAGAALRKAREQTLPGGLIVAAGSIYLIGRLRGLLV